MSAQKYLALARKHWTKWLPERVRTLKADGTLEAELQTAARNAQRKVTELMEQGYRQHEAEEVALAEFVLLKPEPTAEMDPWERRELGKLDREYRKSTSEADN